MHIITSTLSNLWIRCYRAHSPHWCCSSDIPYHIQESSELLARLFHGKSSSHVLHYVFVAFSVLLCVNDVCFVSMSACCFFHVCYFVEAPFQFSFASHYSHMHDTIFSPMVTVTPSHFTHIHMFSFSEAYTYFLHAWPFALIYTQFHHAIILLMFSINRRLVWATLAETLPCLASLAHF